jgi:hypothetical protein
VIDRWRQRINDVVAKTPTTPESGTVRIPVNELRVGDVFDFSGATLRAETITSIGTLVEIEAVGPFNVTTLHYLPFETITVFLPRAESLA